MNPETILQNEIRLALGLESDLAIFRNNEGVAVVFDASCAATGKPRRIAYGLGDGSPDLIAMLTVPVEGYPLGLARWFCLEVKTPNWRPRNARDKARWQKQLVWLAMARNRGAFGCSVRSVADARAALARARLGLSQ